MKYSMPKALRDRKRYISFYIACESRLEEEDVKKAIWGVTLSLIGEVGTASSNIWFISWDQESQKGMIRCSPHIVDYLIVALKCIGEVRHNKANFIVLGVSGTIKSLSSSDIVPSFT